MNKIGNISVRDISKVGFTLFVSPPTFFNIFASKLQDHCRIAFRTYVIDQNFDLGRQKNLAGEF